MSRREKTIHGFTIVELLIIIVIIAILAAITIVAYNGIQNRTNDAAVQTDLRNIAQTIEQYNVINGNYGVGGGTVETDGSRSGQSSDPPTSLTTVSVSKNAYKVQNTYNLIFCQGIINGTSTFAVAAISKSNTAFSYMPSKGVRPYTGTWSTVTTICTTLGFVTANTYTISQGRSLTAWSSWVN